MPRCSAVRQPRSSRKAISHNRPHAGALAVAVLAASLFALPAAANELPLRRVVLASIGLAQFTHAGSVSAGSSIDLPVRLDQVDDLLKSLTVFDREGGIGAVSLPGKAPLQELFRDLPFGPEALGSPSALLNALVGSEIEIAGPVNAKGRVFRVEPFEVRLPNDGGTLTRHRLSLMSETGLVQAVLEDVTTLQFTDPQARAQIERALQGLSENRAKERRKLSLDILGEGTREIALSYVVAAPVWKTSYRLVLPKDGGRAKLQGWAVVENLTGGDWKDVELTLVSGNPVALRQPLYTAFFSDRIEVPVTAGQKILPKQDDSDTAPMAKSADARPVAPTRSMAMAGLQQREAQRYRSGNSFQAAPVAGAPPPPPMPETLGTAAVAAEAEEAPTQLLYRFPSRISLATGHTMMVPFLDREVAASRTWLYQPDTHARRPLAAVRLRNDGDATLPAGIVTTFEAVGEGATNFVGDAQLPLLPKGTFKFVTLALDTKTDIRREDQGVQRTTLGKAVNGELTITTRSRRTIAYEVTPPTEEDREIIVEEPRAAGWAPSADQQEIEETPTRFRFKIDAPKGSTAKSKLVVERTDRRIVHLTSLAPEQILTTIQGLENETPALKSAVARLGETIGEINRARAQRSQLEAERKKIGEDQERIRRNLGSVGANSDLGRRYLETLKSQEERLGVIARSDQLLEAEIAARRTVAEEIARGLSL
ncbi:MAG TPA: DUF4139 domain-containing protein [Hyphomicrobiaceae bacterium]|nr:DUF4139 domain-containing protein [Hyphomicrobiaceae bacterium]